MKVIVSNKILVHDANSNLRAIIDRDLTVDNPEFYKKEQMGKWTGNVQKKIVLYEKSGDVLALPFGYLSKLATLVPPIDNDYVSEIPARRPRLYADDMTLYDYQAEAVVKALEKKNGIVVMPCGSGKTQTALKIVSMLGGRTLWLTHTQDLLRQSMDRAKSVFNCDKSMFGTITEGKINASEGITFATVQTLSRIDLSDYRKFWDVIIVDECQHCCGTPTRVTQFYKVLSSLSARYKFGLTATPKRADGLEIAMFALLGDVVHEVTREQVADTTCPIRVSTFKTRYTPDQNVVLMGDGTIDYSKLVQDLTQNEERLQDVSAVISFYESPMMVLANRVEYLKNLQKLYSRRSVCLSGQGTSKAAKAERKEALRKLNDGELDCVFATYQLAKEGLDVPQLRTVVLATPEKDETTVVQSVGRVGRKADGKEFGLVVDFEDDFGMYRGWMKKRMSFYKSIGAELID